MDTSLDRRAAVAIVLFLAGPVIWGLHFLLVYLVAEAGCTGAGSGLWLFDPPVPRLFTLVATAVGALACAACAAWSRRHWRSSRREATDDPSPSDLRDADLGASLAFGGMLLSLLSVFSILMVGLPAVVLGPC